MQDTNNQSEQRQLGGVRVAVVPGDGGPSSIATTSAASASAALSAQEQQQLQNSYGKQYNPSQEQRQDISSTESATNVGVNLESSCSTNALDGTSKGHHHHHHDHHLSASISSHNHNKNSSSSSHNANAITPESLTLAYLELLRRASPPKRGGSPPSTFPSPIRGEDITPIPAEEAVVGQPSKGNRSMASSLLMKALSAAASATMTTRTTTTMATMRLSNGPRAPSSEKGEASTDEEDEDDEEEEEEGHEEEEGEGGDGFEEKRLSYVALLTSGLQRTTQALAESPLVRRYYPGRRGHQQQHWPLYQQGIRGVLEYTRAGASEKEVGTAGGGSALASSNTDSSSIFCRNSEKSREDCNTDRGRKNNPAAASSASPPSSSSFSFPSLTSGARNAVTAATQKIQTLIHSLLPLRWIPLAVSVLCLMVCFWHASQPTPTLISHSHVASIHHHHQQQQQQLLAVSSQGKYKEQEEEGTAVWVMPPKEEEMVTAEAAAPEAVEEDHGAEKQEEKDVAVLEEENMEALEDNCVSVEKAKEIEELTQERTIEEQKQQRQMQQQSRATPMVGEEKGKKQEEEEDEQQQEQENKQKEEFAIEANVNTEALPTANVAAAEEGDVSVVKTSVPEQGALEHGQEKEVDEDRSCDVDHDQEEEEVVINPLPSILAYAPPPPIHVQSEDTADDEDDDVSNSSSSSSSSSTNSLHIAHIHTHPAQDIVSRPVPDEAKQVATTAPPSSPTSVRQHGDVGLSGAAMVAGWGSGRAELERLYDRGFVSEDISLMEVVTVFGLEYLHHMVQTHRERLRELKQGWCLPRFSWRGGACAPNPVVRFALVMWDVARGEARRVQRLAIEWGGMAAHQVQLALPAPPGPGAAEAAAQAAGEIIWWWQEKVTTSVVRTAKRPLAFLQGLKDRGGVMMMRKEKGKGKGGKRKKAGVGGKKRKKNKGEKTGTGVTAAPTTPSTKRKAAAAAALPVEGIVGEEEEK